MVCGPVGVPGAATPNTTTDGNSAMTNPAQMMAQSLGTLTAFWAAPWRAAFVIAEEAVSPGRYNRR
jgi:hypothetical protein